jgi:hypothetical protein
MIICSSEIIFRTTALINTLIYLPDGDMMDWSALPCSKLLSVGRTPDPLVMETCPHWPYRSMTAYTPVIIQNIVT